MRRHDKDPDLITDFFEDKDIRISHNTQVEQAIHFLLKIKSSTSLHNSIIAHLFKKKLNKENTLGFFEVHRYFEADLHISTLTIYHRPSPASSKARRGESV